jgi:septal ring factor EnvC (AmiA/AmiB activator)
MSTTDTPSPSAMSAAREILNAIFLPISKAMLEPYSPDPADVALCSEIIDRELAAAQAELAQNNKKLFETQESLRFWKLSAVEILDDLKAAREKIAELQTLADNQAEDIERLLADKARLDWLEDDQNRTLLAFTLYASQTYREGIDAARKERQP